MMRRLLALVLSVLLVSSATAQQPTQQSVRDDAKAWVAPVANSASGIADDATAAAANVPGYNTANPPESTYLNNPGALGTAVIVSASSNPAATLVINGSSSRPQVPTQQVDQTVARGEIITADPATYAQGVSVNGTTGQCVELPQTNTSPGNFEARCNVGAQLIPEVRSCTVPLTHVFVNGNDYRCTAVSINGIFDLNSGCGAFTAPTCTLIKEGSVPLYTFSGCIFSACFTLNIAQDRYRASCSAPVTGTLTGNAWTHPVTNVVYAPSFAPAPTYVNSVPDQSQCQPFASDPGCSSPVDVCIDSNPATRDINGTQVTQSCWAWSRTYQCNKIGSNTDCTALDANSACQYNRTECLDDPQVGPCQVEERVYTCPIPGTANQPKQYLCGGDLYCVGGECEAVTRDASDEFKDAVVGLESLAQANREFSDIDYQLFKGTVMSCHKPVFGLVNCCAGKSSGLIPTGVGLAALAGGPVAIAGLATPFLTMFLCSPSEMELDVRDRMGLCHTLGSYCSSKFLGICKTRRTTSCCFLSKLTRILQEQGRVQLGKGWGSPKSPDCSGFSVDEFAALDLSKMDFTEVYQEFMDAAKVPDEAAAMTDIQQKIQAYYSRGGPP